jgi:hypothetical protein
MRTKSHLKTGRSDQRQACQNQVGLAGEWPATLMGDGHHAQSIRHQTVRLLIFISAFLVAACSTVTRWPTTALLCDNDDFCHAIQQARIACHDAALAALPGTNVEE